MRKIYYNRKTIRLQNYDYSKNGMYFITICTKNREPKLSKICTKSMQTNVGAGFHPCPPIKNRPNKQNISPLQQNSCQQNIEIIQMYTQIGKIIEDTIKNMNQLNYIKIEPYVIMPDHIHFIVELKNDICNNDNVMESYRCIDKLNLDDNCGGCSNDINKMNLDGRGNFLYEGRGGTLPLHAIIGQFKSFTTKQYNLLNKTIGIKLWQRGFYEHIIRNENEYYRICEYIRNNPIRYFKKYNSNHNLHL